MLELSGLVAPVGMARDVTWWSVVSKGIYLPWLGVAVAWLRMVYTTCTCLLFGWLCLWIAASPVMCLHVGAMTPDNEGKWHPVSYLSKKMTSAEENYNIHNKELLAIIRATETWRHLLEGSKFPFEIWTDHKNLLYFEDAQDISRRQA